MYCHSEICIATPKYVLPLRNMYCHSEICYVGGMHTFANHNWEGRRPLSLHERVGNGFHVFISSSYRARTVCRRPSAHGQVEFYGQSFEYAQNSCRAWRDGGVPWTCSTVGKRPTVCFTVFFRRLHQLCHTVANGEPTRRSVTAALHLCGRYYYLPFNHQWTMYVYINPNRGYRPISVIRILCM